MTVEVVGSSYGPEWSVAQIVEQATKEIPIELRNKLEPLRIRVVGEPEVTVVMAVPEKK